MPSLPGFIRGSYKSTAQEVDNAVVKNLYPEATTEDPFAKAPIVLYGSPGTTLYLDLADGGPIRGLFELEDYTYVVSGVNAYQIDPSGIVTNIGTVASDNKPVSWVFSATQGVLVSAGIAYALNAGAVAPIGSPPWTTAVDCEFLDGFFIILDDDGLPAGGQFFISGLNDATTWDPLDFSTAPASNNKLRALSVDHENLFIFGTVVTQPFYNNGNADFPFVLNTTGIMQQGIMARATVSLMDNTTYWLGRNKDGLLQAFLADGYTPKRISNNALEAEWLNYATPDDAIAWTCQIKGHSWYHINFIQAQKSWRFDRSTNLWHQVAFRNPVTGQDECHRGNSHVVRGLQHLVGDRQTAQIWELSPDIYADGANPLVASLTTPAPFQGNKNVFYSLFELITPGGIGNGTVGTPETNPSWMLEWSNDSGHNYGPQFQLQAGKIGEYGKRLRKVGVGSGRNRVFRVSISAAVPRCLIGAEYEAELGTS
jgi:hypothetical protein